MSIRPRYGSNGVRRRSAYDQAAEESGWFSWRDMRPVLLKSAGIVGLAGAIMAVVSSNALFVDPGGPDRPSRHAASDDRNEQAPGVVIATTYAPTEIAPAEVAPAEVAPAEVAPTESAATNEGVPTESTAAVVLPPAEVSQPETTASVIPAEPRPARPVAPPQAVEAAPAPVKSPPASETPDAPPPDAVAQSPAAAGASEEAAADASAKDSSGQVSALWPKDSVVCPRDWLVTPAADGSARKPAGCESIASVVQPEADNLQPLHAALPEKVLDLVALAPTIPVPGKDAEPSSAPEASAAAPEPEPKPMPVRASRASDWPAEPPPDCGDKHAYWHFVKGHHGAKEWYCK